MGRTEREKPKLQSPARPPTVPRNTRRWSRSTRLVAGHRQGGRGSKRTYASHRGPHGADHEEGGGGGKGGGNGGNVGGSCGEGDSGKCVGSEGGVEVDGLVAGNHAPLSSPEVFN